MKATAMATGLFAALAALAIGVAFLYEAFCTGELAAENVGLVLQSRLMDPWAMTWVWRGNAARFVEMNAPKAVGAYREAIRHDPLLLDAWFALGRLESQVGSESSSATLYRFLTRRLPDATPWRWQQLLLAYDRQDREGFHRAFNFVMERLPGKRREALETAHRFWGTWDRVILHVAAENRLRVLHLLMDRKETEAALFLYRVADEDGAQAVPKGEKIRLVDYLISAGSLTEAAKIWKQTRPKGAPLMTNGNFESPLLKKAFGWRIGRSRAVEVRPIRQGAYEGLRAMRFHFLGTDNVRYNHFRQLVPVEGGRAYELRFARRAQRITTDRGVYLEIRNFRCAGLRAKSKEITGTQPWGRESVRFRVPDDCEAIWVGIRRDESLKFDNKISGNYWIDAVELSEENGKAIRKDRASIR